MRIVRSAALVGALVSIVGLVASSTGCSTSTGEAPNPETSPEAPAQLDPAVAEGAHASPVQVGWEEDASPLFVRQGELHAWLYNERAEPRTAQLYAKSRLGAEKAIVSLGTVTLGPHERRVIDVAIDALPVQNVASPVAVSLFVDAAENGVEKRFPSESLYVAFTADYAKVMASHVDPTGPLVAAAAGGDEADARVADLLAGKRVTPKAAAALVERLGKPAGRIRGADGAFHAIDTTASVSIASTSFAAGLGQDVSVTQTLQAIPRPTSHPAKICAFYDVQYTDSHFGEDYLADGMWKLIAQPPIMNKVWVPFDPPARFARIRVTPNGNNFLGTTHLLDATGCATVNLTPGNYTVTVSTWVSNGTTTFDVEKVQALQVDQTCEMLGGVSSNGIGGASRCQMNDSFTGVFTMPAASYSVSFSSGDETPAFRVAAVAGHVLSLPDHGLKPETYVAYANSGCGSFNWQEACASGGVAYYGDSVGVGHKDTTLAKFIVAHEMGHAFEQHAYGNFAYDYTSDPTAPASCRCDHVVSANHLHCLQSRHSFSTAHTEGFAQFIAEHTFNKTTDADCTFVYYKEVLDSGSLMSPPVLVNCADPPKWMENHCLKADSSTEWDLLSFLRGATSGTDALTMADVFGVYGKAHQTSATLTWPGLMTAALQYFGNDAANPSYVHLLAAAAAAGVQH